MDENLDEAIHSTKPTHFIPHFIKDSRKKVIGSVWHNKEGGWTSHHYKTNVGHDFHDSREEAIDTVKDQHKEYLQHKKLKEETMTRDIIDYAYDDNGTEFRAALYASISDKVNAHLEAQKQRIAQNLVMPKQEETVTEPETEQEQK